MFANPAKLLFLYKRIINERKDKSATNSSHARVWESLVHIFNPEIYVKPKSYGHTKAGSYGRIKRLAVSRKSWYNSGAMFTDLAMR